ncbi:MAG TPA: adenylate/guanylate cyclase domain-containing protein [Gaiellaceae bacterium]|jgi:pimeloyl-ACP methyl ester carboxylesterase|nr:adenylate/guanylate cyclase domain-containing protein [Gaiellaceae bacterium]
MIPSGDRTISYARNGDVHIAYTVLGDGPIDLVYTNGIFSNLDVMWEEPRWSRYADRLASFSRLIVFDMRGIGLSDRGPEPPYLELQMDDLRAVMDATGSETAAIFGAARGGAMTMLFAATYPERVRALVLYAASVKTMRSDDWPYGRTPEEAAEFLHTFTDDMGTGINLRRQAPEHWDEQAERWWARFERSIASKAGFRELGEVFQQIDVRAVVPSIQAPTLLLHRTGDPVVPVGMSRWLADTTPQAKLVELPGADHIVFLGDTDALADEIEEFLTGARRAPETDRVLATVLFTDIVGSTEKAAALGDRRWRDLLEDHHASVRRELLRFRGHEVDTAGDGFMASFDGPARAIRCAQAIHASTAPLGVEIRAGVHTGECERIEAKLSGIAVHIAARVAATARAREVLVSQTVKDLVAGSGITFEDRGVHELKGVPEAWRLFAVVE